MTHPGRTVVVLALALLLAPAVADACPVCFGAGQSALLDSARLGVLAMVGVTLSVLAAFGAFFMRLRRLAAAHAEHPRDRSVEARS